MPDWILAIVGIIQKWLADRGSARRIRDSTRLAALPILEVIFNRAPDNVLLKNASPSAAAARCLLQGFRFSWDSEMWRCTFETTGAIAPLREIELESLIEREGLSPTHRESVPSSQIFTTAFRRALWIEWPDMVLELYVEDMLGNCYRSDVQIDFDEFAFFLKTEQRAEMRPKISRMTCIRGLPNHLKPIDRTKQQG